MQKMKPIVPIVFSIILIIGFLCPVFCQVDSLYYGTLDGVTVKATDNPAHRIIDAAIEARDSNSAFRCSSFRYIKYHKFAIVPTKVSDSLKKLEEQNLFLSESVSEVYYKNPNRKYENITASRTSGLNNPLFNMVLSRFQFQNFYEGDYLEIMESEYVSPVAKGYRRRYDFLIQDTLFDGADTIFVIDFTPRAKVPFKALKGTLYIRSGSFAIQKIKVSPDGDSFLGNVVLEQEYQQMDNGTWFPASYSAYSDVIRMELKGDTLHARAISNITVKEIEIDAPLRNSTFGIYDVEESVKTKQNSERLLQQYRDDTLTVKEAKTYLLLDSIGNKYKIDRKLEMIPSLMDGYLPIGPVNLDVLSVVDYSYVEGWRFGLGLYTNSRFLRCGNFGGYFAYGLKDKMWKWGARTEWTLYEKRNLTFKLKIFNDVVESGSSDLITRDEYGLFEGEVFRHWIIRKVDFSRTLWGKLQMRLDKNFMVAISSAYSQNQALYDYAFVPFENAEDGRFSYTNACVRAAVRFAYHETSYKSQGISIYSTSQFPTLQLQYERGIKGVFGSDFNYNKILFRIHYYHRYKKLGHSEVVVNGGWVDRSLPYSLLFAAHGGYDKIGLDGMEQFATMRPNEFFGDEYVSLFFRHNFGKLREGSFSPRIVLCQNICFGWLGNPENHLGIDVKSLEKGYFETGILVNNLISAKDLLAMGIGLFYRYGAYGFSKWEQNFAVKVSITVPLAE